MCDCTSVLYVLHCLGHVQALVRARVIVVAMCNLSVGRRDLNIGHAPIFGVAWRVLILGFAYIVYLHDTICYVLQHILTFCIYVLVWPPREPFWCFAFFEGLDVLVPMICWVVAYVGMLYEPIGGCPSTLFTEVYSSR